MKYILTFSFVIMITLLCAQSENQSGTTNQNPNYNETLAKKTGADDYGMKAYHLVILKSGSNTTTDKQFINNCFRGHLDNINKLVKAGKMVVAGPLGKNDHNYRGIFIFGNVKSQDEVKELLMTDPAIENKLLDFEIYDWYGSAALPEYLPAADMIWKIKP